MKQRGMEIAGKTIRWMMSSLLLTATALLVFAMLLWATELSEEQGAIYGLLSCGAGSALCGLGGGRIMKSRGLFWGMAYGFLFLLTFLCVLFAVTGGLTFPAVLRPGFAFCILAGGISGILGVNLRKE